MTGKTALTIAGVNVAVLLLGGMLGRFTARRSDDEARLQVQLAEEARRTDLESRLAKLQADFESAESERQRLRGENDGLAARVAGLAGELKAEREKADSAARAAGARKLGLAFGSYAELEALEGSDWTEISSAIKALHDLYLELLAAQEKGDPLSAELQEKLSAENVRLMRFATGIMGKLPTHAAWNGEYSHPLVLANIMDAVLNESGLPLTRAQKEAFIQAGSGFDSEYGDLQKGYTGETPMLEKMVDELALKEEYARSFYDILSSEQLDAIAPPGVRDRAQNLVSPGASMVSGIAIQYASAEEARSQFQQKLLKDVGMDPGAASSLKEAFDEWQAQIAPLLAPRSPADGQPTREQALLACRVEANLLKRILAAPGLDPKVRAAIIGQRAWTVPQLLAKRE